MNCILKKKDDRINWAENKEIKSEKKSVIKKVTSKCMADNFLL